MIGSLEGRLAETWQQAARYGVLLICHGVGYELQLSQRHGMDLPPLGSELTLHVHQSIREDGWTLFGFPDRTERDLFRELLSVSGVGPQAALGLIGTLEAPELVRAVVQADLRRLCQAPGVGKRTGERLSVELRQRLQERFAALLAGGGAGHQDPADPRVVLLEPQGMEEVSVTLAALGYETLEVQRALRAVAAAGLHPEEPVDNWIRECLRWLSRSAA